MKNRLHNKVAIIIGASRGIGAGIARVFAQEGAQLLLAARNEKPLLELTHTLKNEIGAEIDCYRMDTTKLGEVEAMVEYVLKKHGRIDVLCQNAGIYPKVLIEDMTEEDWDLVHNTNLKGAFFALKTCLKVMRKQQYGKIVVTSSITGPIVGNPGLAHYSATKSGINGFVKTAALEYAKDNITINVVESGNIATQSLCALGDDYIDSLNKTIPMKKLGEPEDIGYATLFLASDESKYMTGQSIVVDGGLILPETFFKGY